MSDGELLTEQLATVVAALCSVASLGGAIARGPVGTNYIGQAIEGQAAAALQALSCWTIAIPGRPARALDARIRACLGYGDRTLLGAGYARGLVATARRNLEPH